MGDTPYDDLHADDTSVSENPLVGRLERELASLRAEKERAEDAKVLAIQQRNEMLLKLNLAEAERDDAIADATAVRELMNCYNLGGWTDSVSVMQRALKAEAERDAALKDAWKPIPDEVCIRIVSEWYDADESGVELIRRVEAYQNAQR